jgi:hypothetical protein
MNLDGHLHRLNDVLDGRTKFWNWIDMQDVESEVMEIETLEI